MWGENNPSHVDRYMAEGRFGSQRNTSNNYQSSTYSGGVTAKGSHDLIVRYYNIASRNAGNHKYKKAIKYYRKILKIDSSDAGAWNNMGLSYKELGKCEEAFTCFEKTISLDAKNTIIDKKLKAIPFYNLAGVYDKLKNYEKAKLYYNKCLELYPEHVESLNNLGTGYMGLHDYENAIKCLDKAIQINPEFPLAWYNKACIESMKHNLITSIEYLKKAFELKRGLIALSIKDEDFKNLNNSQEFQKLLDEFSFRR